MGKNTKERSNIEAIEHHDIARDNGDVPLDNLDL